MAAISVNEVYRKIKEMSAREMNPRPKIMVQQLVDELMITQDNLMPCLTALKDMRLINAEGYDFTSIKLTLLGTTVNR